MAHFRFSLFFRDAETTISKKKLRFGGGRGGGNLRGIVPKSLTVFLGNSRTIKSGKFIVRKIVVVPEAPFFWSPFLFAEPYQILGKGRKNAQKRQGRSEIGKSNGNRKKQGFEGLFLLIDGPIRANRFADSFGQKSLKFPKAVLLNAVGRRNAPTSEHANGEI